MQYRIQISNLYCKTLVFKDRDCTVQSCTVPSLPSSDQRIETMNCSTSYLFAAR